MLPEHSRFLIQHLPLAIEGILLLLHRGDAFVGGFVDAPRLLDLTQALVVAAVADRLCRLVEP